MKTRLPWMVRWPSASAFNLVNSLSTAIRALARAVCLAAGATAWAACSPIDFDGLAVNTAVTNQFAGVTFSVEPQTCQSERTLYMRINVPPHGTASGTQCIKIDNGCPDFSRDYLCMVFDTPQHEVSFTLGDWTTRYTIRYYSTRTQNEAGLIDSLDVVIPPAGGGEVGVHRRVTVTTPLFKPLRRIEVQATDSNREAIDDLTFQVDGTPPVAEITSPVQMACVCNSTPIIGSASDPDGPITSWRLERKRLGVATWTLIATGNQEVINDRLATWTTTAPDGYYALRLTVRNGCDLETVATTDVYLDKAFNSLVLRRPVDGAIVGGRVCADGTAADQCGGAITLEYGPATGGAWHSFDEVKAVGIITDELGSWNTRTVNDGDYVIRLTGNDPCGNSVSTEVGVTVDNTLPIAVITSPTPCAAVYGRVQIRGTANDTHLLNWSLQYTGGNLHHWVEITNQTTPVLDGVLAEWDTAGLPPCAYTVRLLVADASAIDCNGERSNWFEYTTSFTLVGDPLTQDTDADSMSDAWETAHGFNPLDPADAPPDADQDGQSNLAECLAGTDPHDPNSALRITGITRDVEGVRVTWTTVGGHYYLLQARADLPGAPEDDVSPLLSVPPGGPATTNYLHLVAATATQRYYRVRLVP